MIPVFKPNIGKEEIEELTDTIKSTWIGLGPKTKLFEDRFAKYVGSKYAIGTNSGTSSLFLALKVLGIREGDEVILPSLTFVSTAHVILYCGATPVFADVLEDTLCIDPEDIKKKITPRTRAVISVDFGGHPCDYAKILPKMNYPFDIPLIVDTAHSCGSKYYVNKAGALGDLSCFSFHAVKNLTTGDGGMITTNHKDYYDTIRKLRWMGITKTTYDRYAPKIKQSSFLYEVPFLGYKMHMNDIIASLGLCQLKKLDSGNKARHEIFEYYNKHLSDLGWLEIPIEKPYVESSHHLYQIRIDSDRVKFAEYMQDNGIAVSLTHYPPIHLMPIYEKYRAKLPVTEKVYNKLVTLPNYPGLTIEELNYIVETIRRYEI